MFTAPAPSAPTLSTSTSPVSPTSPSRSNRLRGLSYLRNYTHSHLHSHSHSSHSRSPTARSPGASSPTAETANPLRSSPRDLAQAISLITAGATSIPRPAAAARAASAATSSSVEASSSTRNMTRTRAESSTAATSQSLPGGGSPDASDKSSLPSIRFIPHSDPRAARPSLTFPAVTRTLPDEHAIIRVGRYSERDGQPDVPNNVASSAPVGFKSKVVSRRHCEFWYADNRWWIKDVKSSSGTFLNHIRLSQPGVESRPYEIKDGDVVQLGIDFRGGEEMIFRCVKIRIECNRGWQQALNSFNKSTHKRLRNLAKSKTKSDADNASSHSSECSICLMAIAPCQSLFVAPCSHVWHYKCIRPILQGPTAPSFLCPNCRAVTDLEADIDEIEFESGSEIEEIEKDAETQEVATAEQADLSTSHSGDLPTPPASDTPAAANPDLVINGTDAADAELADAMERTALNSSSLEDTPASTTSTTAAIAIPRPINTISSPNSLLPARSAVPECPMTPRNDVGPFLIDGGVPGANNTRRPPNDIAEVMSSSA